MTQEREKAPTARNHIVSSAVSCLSRLKLLISNVSEYIQCSRPLQFSACQHIQHPYVCFIVKLIVWLVLWAWFISCGFGAVFFIISLICFVWMNTGTKPREPGVLSAYSVFNRNCERIDGTFTAEQFEKELRQGSFTVHWHSCCLNAFRVTTHPENLENLEKSRNSKVVRENGKSQGKWNQVCFFKL